MITADEQRNVHFTALSPASFYGQVDALVEAKMQQSSAVFIQSHWHSVLIIKIKLLIHRRRMWQFIIALNRPQKKPLKKDAYRRHRRILINGTFSWTLSKIIDSDDWIVIIGLLAMAQLKIRWPHICRPLTSNFADNECPFTVNSGQKIISQFSVCKLHRFWRKKKEHCRVSSETHGLHLHADHLT